MRTPTIAAKRLFKQIGLTRDRKPRIYNVTRDVEFMGSTEVNTMATTPFCRVKSHKGWFEGAAEVADGDLILDRVFGTYYLVMSVRGRAAGGEVSYYDGTLYNADVTCTVQRIDPSIRDRFGRVVGDGWVDIATDVRIMVTPIAINTIEQEDQIHTVDKVRVAIQQHIGVQQQDRLVTSTGNTFKVNTIDMTSLPGLWLLGVETDIR
jgi:hypothetical protein